MGYQLRLHNEIRDWLADLRASEPELARSVGEAVLAMLEAGESLGPPLVVLLESVLRPSHDPSDVLDFSYQRHVEALTKVRSGVTEIAASRKRVELQAIELENSAAKLASQRADALSAGREDLAGEAQRLEALVQEQLSQLRRQLVILTQEQEKLTAASQRMQAKVHALRVQKETIQATSTAAQAFKTLREASAETGTDTSDLEVMNTAADASSGFGGTATPANDLRQERRDLIRTSEDDIGFRDRDGTSPPPGMMELRPGAPGNVRVGLLFVVEPQDTAVVVAAVEAPGGSPDDYQEGIRIAAARLPGAQSRPLAAAASSDDAFTSYDPESFLDEFFPGEETEVEIGAGALVARNRARTLAEARQQMRLTQAQVAQRMNVRQERVSAIERAEPGATEIRTLAAYVHALGGRLEIIATVGNERILLK
jgi:phage shock protein A/DNA-binding XRE family transcriptional regulator